MSKKFNILQRGSRSIFMKQLILGITFLIMSLNLYGQTTYPVQVYTQLTPPYTPYLPAYYSGTNEKLKVTLINTDMKQPTLSVYLRMKIKSSSFTIETPENVYTERIELQAGVPLKLSLGDLACYFKNDNIRISGGRNEFLKTRMLPDNFYRFSFEVYEANTNRLLSNPKLGFAQAMISTGEPPVLNLPLKGATIMESNIPSIMFSWTPRHMNSVASAYGTEYEFTLVEIYDKQVAPEAAFDYSRILYTETVRSTSFIHTIAQPVLIPGMRYAWRVRAVAREGLEEANVFKNNGYSPVSWFDYTVDCKQVQYDRVEVKDRIAIISWQATDAIDYDVQYRKKGAKRWYSGSLTNKETCPVYNLRFGEEYEYRIGVRCTMNDAFTYTDIKRFKMPHELEKSPNCGILPNINVSNQVPARELQAKLPILVGDFPVFITKVSGSGRFTGEGYVGIPYLKNAKIAVTFKDIVINTDNRMIAGFIETKYDISGSGNNLVWDVDETLTGGKGVGDIRTGEEKARYTVDYTIDSNLTQVPVKKDISKDEIKENDEIETTSGENERYIITLTDDEGNTHEQVVDKFPATIADSSGAIYEVDEDGNIRQVSSDSDIKLDEKDKYIQDKTATIQFESIAGVTRYALDVYDDVYKEVAEFEREYVVEEGQEIRASVKFIETNSSDDIFVKLSEAEDGFNPEKVRFVTSKQKEYKAAYDAEKKGWTLTLIGSDANDGQMLFVVYEKGNNEYGTLAVLKIVSYTPKSVDVALVPVNGAKGNFADITKIKEDLNKIYNKVGITVNFTLEDNFDYPVDEFDVTGSGLFSTRTNDMKAIEAAFSQTKDYKENVAYLFIMDISPDVDDQRVVHGDMPRKSQFGYLFRGATSNTIAHEIGHGLFYLDHPFARANAANSFKEESLTDNLMHYHNGTDLAKLQWDAIHSPGLVIGLFEKDEDGMVSTILQGSQLINDPQAEAIFYIGNKKYIIIFNEKLKAVSNNQITDKNNKTYVPVRLLDSGTFVGFYEKENYQKLAVANNNTVNLATDDAKQINQFKAYEIKSVEDLSVQSRELCEALLEHNTFDKVNAIITLRQALSEDEYLFAFKGYSYEADCQIDLSKNQKYDNECLDRYIDALTKGLNPEVEYFDYDCNCIVKKSKEELLGNSVQEFQEWFESIGGTDAILALEEFIYEKNIQRYSDNIARGIYGTDEYGIINVPQSIKEKVRKEARDTAFPSLRAAWAIEKSGADPNGLIFNFSPISFDRFSYYYYLSLSVTSKEDAKAIITDVGLQVAIQWVFEIVPAVNIAKGNIKSWKTAKIEPNDLIGNIEKRGYQVIDANEEYIVITGDQLEGRVSIAAKDLNNIHWINNKTWEGYTNIFKANLDEITEAAAKIKNYRISNNLGNRGNFGYLEGTVNGKVVNNKMWRSVSLDIADNEIHIFKAIEIEGKGGNAWLRITDSEYRMLNDLAYKLGGQNGRVYPNITGEIKIVSENPYCKSCQGIIQQFHEMFPNIKVILIDGIK